MPQRNLRHSHYIYSNHSDNKLITLFCNQFAATPPKNPVFSGIILRIPPSTRTLAKYFVFAHNIKRVSLGCKHPEDSFYIIKHFVLGSLSTRLFPLNRSDRLRAHIITYSTNSINLAQNTICNLF